MTSQPPDTHLDIASKIAIGQGLRAKEIDAAAVLFWEAFADKLGRILGPAPRAHAYLCRSIVSRNVLCARMISGELVGLAGLKTRAGGFLGGDAAILRAVYGRAGALWRGPLLNLTDRPLAEGHLSVDGLCVASAHRGAGIGGRLLDAVEAHGRELGSEALVLDVVDTNPRARQFYLRAGFVPGGTRSMGLLRPVFGFSTSETLVRPL